MDAASQEPKAPVFSQRRAGSDALAQSGRTQRGFTVAQRLAAIAIGLLLPLGLAVTVLFNQQQTDINIAIRERDGATYLESVGLLSS